MGARMYFSESSRRDMQVSQEEFDRRWDLAFGKKEEETPQSVSPLDSKQSENLFCTGCTNSCFVLGNKEARKEWFSPFSRMEYYGYCKIKNEYVFKIKDSVRADILHKDDFFTVKTREVIHSDDTERKEIVMHCYHLIPEKDRKYINISKN